MTIRGYGFLIHIGLQFFLFLLEGSSLCFIFLRLCFARIQDHGAVNGIEDDLLAILRLIHDAGDADNCRNFQRTRHDGTVACTAADFRCKSFCKFLVQAAGVRRGQFLGNDDNRFAQRCEVRNLLAFQVAQQTERNILDICCTFLHVGIIHAFEHGDHHIRYILCSKVRILFPIADLIFNLAAEIRILDHHQVRIEDRKFFFLQVL